MSTNRVFQPWNKLVNRSRQFFRAAFSQMTPQDHAFVEQYLDAREKKLFYNMDSAVQKHCVNVALTALESAVHYPAVDRVLLGKAALLHDIGKIRGSFTVFDRILYVLVNTISPGLTARLARQSTGNGLTRFRNAFHVHLTHGETGAALAKEVGLNEELVYLLRNHHNKSLPFSREELRLLSKADELN